MSTVVLYADINDSWFIHQYAAWQNILNSKEQERFGLMKSTVKKKQLVMSRYLIHQALLKLNYSLNNAYEIVNYNRLVIPNVKQLFSLSITHSGNVAAIILSDQPLKLGIDVEQVKLRNFTELVQEICTPEEISLLAKKNNIQENFYQLWTAKEALAKACNLSLFDCYRCNCTSVLHSDEGIIFWQGDRYFFNRLKYTGTFGIVMCNDEKEMLTNILQFHG